ncbi:MAG: hypothetical protein AVDCRST_MAG93-3069, partial [uncultured Chloroflexia bacterium]
MGCRGALSTPALRALSDWHIFARLTTYLTTSGVVRYVVTYGGSEAG